MDNQKIYGIVLILCLIISNLYLYRKCSKLNTDIKQLLRRVEELENKTNNYDLFMANFVYKQNNQSEIKKHKNSIVHNVDNDEVDDDDEVDEDDDDEVDDVHDHDDEVNDDIEDTEIEAKPKVNKNTQPSKENKKKSSAKNKLKKENTQMLSQLNQLDDELNKELQDLSINITD